MVISATPSRLHLPGLRPWHLSSHPLPRSTCGCPGSFPAPAPLPVAVPASVPSWRKGIVLRRFGRVFHRFGFGVLAALDLRPQVAHGIGLARAGLTISLAGSSVSGAAGTGFASGASLAPGACCLIICRGISKPRCPVWPRAAYGSTKRNCLESLSGNRKHNCSVRDSPAAMRCRDERRAAAVREGAGWRATPASSAIMARDSGWGCFSGPQPENSRGSSGERLVIRISTFKSVGRLAAASSQALPTPSRTISRRPPFCRVASSHLPTAGSGFAFGLATASAAAAGASGTSGTGSAMAFGSLLGWTTGAGSISGFELGSAISPAPMRWLVPAPPASLCRDPGSTRPGRSRSAAPGPPLTRQPSAATSAATRAACEPLRPRHALGAKVLRPGRSDTAGWAEPRKSACLPPDSRSWGACRRGGGSGAGRYRDCHGRRGCDRHRGDRHGRNRCRSDRGRRSSGSRRGDDRRRRRHGVRLRSGDGRSCSRAGGRRRRQGHAILLRPRRHERCRRLTRRGLNRRKQAGQVARGRPLAVRFGAKVVFPLDLALLHQLLDLFAAERAILLLANQAIPLRCHKTPWVWLSESRTRLHNAFPADGLDCGAETPTTTAQEDRPSRNLTVSSWGWVCQSAADRDR